MVTTRPPKTIVKPTALGPVANTDTKLLIYGLFQKGRVLAQDAVDGRARHYSVSGGTSDSDWEIRRGMSRGTVSQTHSRLTSKYPITRRFRIPMISTKGLRDTPRKSGH